MTRDSWFRRLVHCNWLVLLNDDTGAVITAQAQISFNLFLIPDSIWTHCHLNATSISCLHGRVNHSCMRIALAPLICRYPCGAIYTACNTYNPSSMCLLWKTKDSKLEHITSTHWRCRPDNTTIYVRQRYVKVVLIGARSTLICYIVIHGLLVFTKSCPWSEWCWRYFVLTSS